MLIGLTTREWQVLRALAVGGSCKSIACNLNLSAKTIDAHKFNLFRKTGAHTQLELILGALRAGVVHIEDLPALTVRIEAVLA